MATINPTVTSLSQFMSAVEWTSFAPGDTLVEFDSSLQQLLSTQQIGGSGGQITLLATNEATFNSATALPLSNSNYFSSTVRAVLPWSPLIARWLCPKILSGSGPFTAILLFHAIYP